MPRPLTVNQLADELRHDQEVQAVAALYAADHLGKRDASLATVIEAEHVPYLAALRYKDSGLRKRAQWKQVWEQTAPCCSAGPAGTTATRPTPSSD
ncbi:hypothetical protein AB0A89_03890 [Streptomyces albogriseolus]